MTKLHLDVRAGTKLAVNPQSPARMRYSYLYRTPHLHVWCMCHMLPCEAPRHRLLNSPGLVALGQSVVNEGYDLPFCNGCCCRFYYWSSKYRFALNYGLVAMHHGLTKPEGISNVYFPRHVALHNGRQMYVIGAVQRDCEIVLKTYQVEW